ncbi:MAG: serine protease [Bacteroidetes bacterium]|nr:MAG: serine protease [Bacteroidota bacterium]
MVNGIVKFLLCLIGVLAVYSGSSSQHPEAQESKTIVYKFNIKEDIGPGIWRQTLQAFAEAEEANADYIIIHMNTYGGTVVHADSIRTKILNTKTPIFVFIDNNAASAGALISIACDSIYMRRGANIGASTVVNQEGTAMPDKYQSYMRSTMRSTAEATNRNPDIAEAMVDERIKLSGISDSGKVLTFTTKEAIANNYCEGEAESIEKVLQLAGITEYKIIEYKPTQLEKIIGILVNPVLSGILIMIIIGGIYFELQTPGIGFPLAASIIAAVLYFAPLYLEGLANNWEILLFVSGLILIALEVFVIPGFGIAGVLGIIFTITGLSLSMVDNVGFDFTFTHTGTIIRAFIIVLGALVLSITSAVLLGAKLVTSPVFSNLILQATQDSNDGYIGVDNKEKELVGKTGKATTILRPAGKVKIENDIYDAVAETGYIDEGEEVLVIKFETSQLFVRKS